MINQATDLQDAKDLTSGSRMVSASCHCAVSGRGSARPATVNAGRVVGVERSVDAL